MIPNHGFATYPGVQTIFSFEFCDTSGAAPATGTMTIAPQYGFPAENGDIVITYNGVTITLRDMHIDSVRYDVNSGGQIVQIIFVDSRWKWEHREISGRYNFRLPNNYIDPAHEKTPQEMASMCFDALGETIYDVSALPNDARIEADWVCANPAQELDRICNELGCRIVPVRSNGGWRIVVTGEGDFLPEYPADSIGAGIDPQETPDYIKIVSGPIRYQMRLPLGAIGKDIDLSFKTLKDVSFAPFPDKPSGGFGINDWLRFSYIDSTRFVLPDGTKVSRQELAQDSIFNLYRLEFKDRPGCKQNSAGEWGIVVPTIEEPVTRKQIILSNELAEMWTDYLGVLHRRAAYVCGVYHGKLAEGELANYPKWTRIDKQAADSATGMDERASYSLSLDPLDTDRSILSITPKMVKQIKPLIWSDSGATNSLEWQEADLDFVTSFSVRDPETWQPMRVEYLLQIGNGNDTSFVHTVVREDIQPVVIADYDRDGKITGHRSNVGEVESQCQYYAESLSRKFITVESAQRNYVGIYNIDMDGSICQFTYSVSESGCSMMASQGSEHNWYTPDYEERRQQVARQGYFEKLNFIRYEVARRTAYLGNVTT